MLDKLLGRILYLLSPNFIWDTRDTLVRFVVLYWSGLSKDDRSEIYNLLKETLDTNGLSVAKVMREVSISKELEGKSKVSKTYLAIAGESSNPHTETPVSDAFRPYIPSAEYQSMFRSEKRGLLKATLPYIQMETRIRADYVSIQKGKYLKWIFMFWLPTLAVYSNIGAIAGLIDPFWGDKPFDPTYQLWTGVEDIVASSFLAIALAMLGYTAFFYFFKDAGLSHARRLCEKLPFFSDFKAIEAGSSLISISLESKIVSGVPLSSIVRNVATTSSAYVEDHLQSLSADIGEQGYKNALAKSLFIPSKLRGILGLKTIIQTDNNAILEASTLAVLELVEKERLKAEFSGKAAQWVGAVVASFPLAHIMLVSMESMMK